MRATLAVLTLYALLLAGLFAVAYGLDLFPTYWTP